MDDNESPFVHKDEPVESNQWPRSLFPTRSNHLNQIENDVSISVDQMENDIVDFLALKK